KEEKTIEKTVEKGKGRRTRRSLSEDRRQVISLLLSLVSQTRVACAHISLSALMSPYLPIGMYIFKSLKLSHFMHVSVSPHTSFLDTLFHAIPAHALQISSATRDLRSTVASAVIHHTAEGGMEHGIFQGVRQGVWLHERVKREGAISLAVSVQGIITCVEQSWEKLSGRIGIEKVHSRDDGYKKDIREISKREGLKGWEDIIGKITEVWDKYAMSEMKDHDLLSEKDTISSSLSSLSSVPHSHLSAFIQNVIDNLSLYSQYSVSISPFKRWYAAGKDIKLKDLKLKDREEDKKEEICDSLLPVFLESSDTVFLRDSLSLPRLVHEPISSYKLVNDGVSPLSVSSSRWSHSCIRSVTARSVRESLVVDNKQLHQHAVSKLPSQDTIGILYLDMLFRAITSSFSTDISGDHDKHDSQNLFSKDHFASEESEEYQLHCTTRLLSSLYSQLDALDPIDQASHWYSSSPFFFFFSNGRVGNHDGSVNRDRLKMVLKHLLEIEFHESLRRIVHAIRHKLCLPHLITSLSAFVLSTFSLCSALMSLKKQRSSRKKKGKSGVSLSSEARELAVYLTMIAVPLISRMEELIIVKEQDEKKIWAELSVDLSIDDKITKELPFHGSRLEYFTHLSDLLKFSIVGLQFVP
ncbi:hypothetical protein ADUPG1_011292, partial [Aduncisulcus paluster]